MLLLVVVAACTATGPALTAPPRATPDAQPMLGAAAATGSLLGPDDTQSPLAAVEAAAAPGPLRVAFATPRGQTTGPVEIAVVFSKPMRAIGSATSDPSTVVTVSPRVEGRWQWLGSSALRLNAVGELPEATEICAEVPAGTRALDGSVLAEAFRWCFATAGQMTEVISRTLEPFAIRDIRCAPAAHAPGACDPHGADVVIETTTAVDVEALRRALRIEPLDAAAQWWLGAAGSEDPVRSFELSAPFEPGHSYRVSVARLAGAAVLRDDHGQALRAAFGRTLRMADELPSVRFQATGTYWPAGVPKRLPVGTMNVAHGTVEVRALGLADVLATVTDPERADEHCAPSAVPVEPGSTVASSRSGPAGQRARASAELANGARNESVATIVALEPLLGEPDPRGPVRVVADFLGRGSRSAQRVRYDLQLTDLGLVALADRSEASVWVTSLGTGAPVVNVEVAVYGVVPGQSAPRAPIGVATTDRRGMAIVALHLPEPPDGVAIEPNEPDAPQLLIVARAGRDWAHRTVDVPRLPSPVGELFCDRGIYRPGEEVAFKGIVRLPRGGRLATPVGRAVRARVVDGEGGVVASWTGTVSRYGTFAWRARLPADAPRGVYSVRAEVAGGGLRERFFVADYRPAQSTAEASLDRTSYLPGETARCSVRGQMLYGAPMAGAGLSLLAERRPTSLWIDGLPGWTVQDEAGSTTSQGGGAVLQASERLDARGRREVAIPLAFADQGGPQQLSCQVELADLNREVRSASASATIHPADAYAAIRELPYDSVRPGAAIAPAVLVVTPAGERLARAVRVEVRYRHPLPGETAQERLLQTCELTSGREPVSCPAVVPSTPAAPGDALVVRATSADPLGRTARASTVTEILREQPPPPQPSPAPEVPPPTRLELSVEGAPNQHERRFAVGDRVRLRLGSPFPEPALAWVTVVRDSVMLRRVVRLPGRTAEHAQPSAVVEFPVTEAMVPNADVRVTVVSGTRSEWDARTFHVTASSRVLEVSLQACEAGSAGQTADSAHGCVERTGFEPGDELALVLEVRDAAGAPARAEVTLWGADEGSLALAFYATPRPATFVSSERYPTVTFANVRDDIVHTWLDDHRARPPQVRMGATSISGPERSDFRQTVFFEPSLETDSSGRLVHRVRLPDGLTSYRFMAVATALDDRVGSTDVNVTTRRPVMVRPTLPRVIRVGDELEATVVVTSDLLGGSLLNVGARAEGLEPAGPTRWLVTGRQGEPQELRFRMRAARAGAAALHLDATARDRAGQVVGTDSVVARAQVVAPTVLETAVVHGQTRASVTERIGVLDGVRPDIGGLDVSVQTTPLAGLADAMEQLLEYPYGCTEQLVSRMVPLVALSELARSLGVSLGTAPPDPAVTVSQLLAAQRADGGFGLWPSSARSVRWLSIYALWGLGEAARHSVPVPAAARDRARAYVLSALAEAVPPPPAPVHGGSFAEAAFALDVLATEQQPDGPRMALLTSRYPELSIAGRALLLHAMATAGPVEPDTPLLTDLESRVRLDGPVGRVVAPAQELASVHPYDRPLGAQLDSDTRTSAMTLRALAAVDPGHRLIRPLALGLLAARRGGRWRTTQEAAWALLALDAALGTETARATNLDVQLFLGPRQLTRVSFAPSELSRRIATHVPMAELLRAGSAPLLITTSGEGTVHYQARLRYARRELPGAEHAGLVLTKSLRPLTDIALPPGPPLAGEQITLRAGQVALCELLLVTASPRTAIVIDDPLPGGLEAIDPAHGSGGGWLASLESSGVTRRELRDDRVLFFVDELPAGVSRYRYLVRAVTPGRFLAPPSHAEEMYVPETFSRTAPGWVKVVAP